MTIPGTFLSIYWLMSGSSLARCWDKIGTFPGQLLLPAWMDTSVERALHSSPQNETSFLASGALRLFFPGCSDLLSTDVKNRSCRRSWGNPTIPKLLCLPPSCPQMTKFAANTPLPWRRKGFWVAVPQGTKLWGCFIWGQAQSPHLAAAGMCGWSCFVTQSCLQASTQHFLG